MPSTDSMAVLDYLGGALVALLLFCGALSNNFGPVCLPLVLGNMIANTTTFIAEWIKGAISAISPATAARNPRLRFSKAFLHGNHAEGN